MYDDERHPFIRTSSFAAQQHPSISPLVFTSSLFFSLSSRSVSLSLSLSLSRLPIARILRLKNFASHLAIRSFALNSCFGICCCCCCFCCCCDSDFGRGWRCAIKIRTKILCSSLNYWQTDRHSPNCSTVCWWFPSGGDYQVSNCSKGCNASLL